MYNDNDDLLAMVTETLAADQAVSTQSVEKATLTFKRDEKGVLWSYDVKTGKKVGRIFEHGDSHIDKIEEV